jgi:transcriptional regulator with XRE-family HTH domain
MYKLSDDQFSEKLGVDPGTWSKIKRGQREPGAKFLAALVQAFPETKLEVMSYLENRGNTDASKPEEQTVA